VVALVRGCRAKERQDVFPGAVSRQPVVLAVRTSPSEGFVMVEQATSVIAAVAIINPSSYQLIISIEKGMNHV
jgi:hypothetical protein